MNLCKTLEFYFQVLNVIVIAIAKTVHAFYVNANRFKIVRENNAVRNEKNPGSTLTSLVRFEEVRRASTSKRKGRTVFKFIFKVIFSKIFIGTTRLMQCYK
jgi:hypothetical protein